MDDFEVLAMRGPDMKVLFWTRNTSPDFTSQWLYVHFRQYKDAACSVYSGDVVLRARRRVPPRVSQQMDGMMAAPGGWKCLEVSRLEAAFLKGNKPAGRIQRDFAPGEGRTITLQSLGRIKVN